MLIDTFMFNNELDILEGRLEYLYDKVDKFIIVEADHTFSGKRKPFNFLNNTTRYKKFMDKIFYYPLKLDMSNPEFKDPWKVEETQRNHIANALKFFDDEHFVIIGDLDEIPNKTTLDLASLVVPTYKAMTLIYDAYVYGFGYKHVNFYVNSKNISGWPHTVITSKSFVLENSPSIIRRDRDYYPVIQTNSAQGWHLSYWGSPEIISQKINSYSHTEHNTPELNNIENIIDKRSKGMMFTDTTVSTLEPVDPRTIDIEVFKIFRKYSHPMRHYYDIVEGWFGPDDAEFYRSMVEKTQGLSKFVEVGSFKGRSAVCLAVEIFNQNKSITFDCIDLWEPNLYYSDLTIEPFENNLRPMRDFCDKIFKMKSEEAAKFYNDESIDLVFIDADHSYESVKKDILTWLPKVRKGGIISGHDEYFPDVKRAVDSIFDEHQVIGSCWYVIKK